MDNKSKATITIVLLAALTFTTGPLLWPVSHDFEFTQEQLPFLVLLSLLESLAFGAGIAFIFFGWPLMAKISPKNAALKKLTFISIAWSLISWWPHDSLHAANGINTEGLLLIEYGFHVTLMAAAAVIAYYFYSMLKEGK